MSEGERGVKVSFCPTCNKPFTAASSYCRHVSYCRRARSRPKLRRKSCQACKAAKAKCSFQPCCTRCASKGLECTYERTPNDRSVTSTSNQGKPSASLTEDENKDLFSTLIGTDSPETLEPDFPDLELIEELPFVPPSNNDPILTPLSKSVGQTTFLDGVSLLPTTWELPVDFPTGILRRQNLDRYESPSYLTYLTKITLSNPFAQHGADLIIEALYAIPQQMLRLETFPPFIHPHWHLSSLPEPLAVCMQITGMYFLGSSAIRGFVWRSILAEQRRVLQRLDTLGGQELLAETQAGMVYLMMRLLDGVKRDPEWTREVMSIQTALCNRFLEINDFCFCQSEERNPSLTWEDWIYAESRRRTSLVWFLITRTIVVNTKIDCPTAETPQVLPLPASKTQWEARTKDAWMKEMGLESPTMRTVGDLINVTQHVSARENSKLLGAWNAQMDSLGSLLNIALVMV